MNSVEEHWVCIILAAGESSRMKRSKIVLPWGENTVIGNIIQAFQAAEVQEIIVVTGGYRELVEEEIAKYPVTSVYNPNYANGSMVGSLQLGLQKLTHPPQSVFIALGDQPCIDSFDLREMIKLSQLSSDRIIIPSYAMRRGHPWLVPGKFIGELLALNFSETMRDFLKRHEAEIEYFLVKKSNILTDLDSPEDYEKLKKGC